jgi:hypothetical protein
MTDIAGSSPRPKTRLAGSVLAVLSLPIILTGCDTFYDVRYLPAAGTGQDFSAASGVTADSLMAAMKKFAERYSLSCDDDLYAGTIMHCHSGFRFLPQDHVFGGFGVEVNEGHLSIHYQSAEPGLVSFASGCARVEEIKHRLEEFTGPLTVDGGDKCAATQ